MDSRFMTDPIEVSQPSRPKSEDSLKQRVAAIRWWHRIDLGEGIVTPGPDDSPAKLACIRLPTSLVGCTVLDIGAWDGYFSFECERRGASRVLAIDPPSWENERFPFGKEGFVLAREVLGSRVEDRKLDVMDLSPEDIGLFDVVLFLGVFYHLRHPLSALERIAAVTKTLLILETHVDLLEVSRPSMTFYPGAELNRDSTNWWGPNPALVTALLRDVGFSDVTMFSGPSPNRRVFHGIK